MEPDESMNSGGDWQAAMNNIFDLSTTGTAGIEVVQANTTSPSNGTFEGFRIHSKVIVKLRLSNLPSDILVFDASTLEKRMTYFENQLILQLSPNLLLGCRLVLWHKNAEGNSKFFSPVYQVCGLPNCSSKDKPILGILACTKLEKSSEIIILELQVNDTTTHAAKCTFSDFHGGSVKRVAEFGIQFRLFQTNGNAISNSVFTPNFVVTSKAPSAKSTATTLPTPDSSPMHSTQTSRPLDDRVVEMENRISQLQQQITTLENLCRDMKKRLDVLDATVSLKDYTC